VRRALGAAACAASILALLAGTTAWAGTSGAGAQRWTASYQSGEPAFSTAVSLSPDGSTVFVTGSTEVNNSGRFATIAYDASSGAHRWAATFPSDASGQGGMARALAVSPDGSRLFVSGFVRCHSGCDATSWAGYATVAYDGSTGERLWVSRLATKGDELGSIEVSRDGSMVLLSGGDGDEGSELVAYDSSNGVQLWRAHREKAYVAPGVHLSMSPDGETVYVTDTAPPDLETCYSAGGYRTSAYDTADGSLQWSSTYKVTDHASICGMSTGISLSADGLTVFVTGMGDLAIHDHSDKYRSATVAYDAMTGAQLWATTEDDIRMLGGLVTSLEVSPDGSKVFVLGTICFEPRLCPYTTVAYDSSTGHRLWMSRYDGGGLGYATDLAVNPDGSSLFVTGLELMPCFAGCTSTEVDAPLVAYDTATGAERWATTYVDNGGQALAVSPDGSSVYLAGTFTASATTSRAASARAATSCSASCGYSTARYNTGPGPGRLQDSDSSLRYDGWRGFFVKTAVGGAYRASNMTGDAATFTTPRVTSVSWLTHQGPSQGKARLIIDGHFKATFNLYSPTRSARTITFDGLARQAHTVKVKVLGRKGPASKGTWVAVDGFRFHAGNGIAQEPSAEIRYNRWTGRARPSASGGSLRQSGSRAAKVSLDFTGRTIKWITATGPAFGRAKVVIDGKTRIVDLYRPTQHWKVAITYTGLSKGRHHITIRPLGRKDASSTSTNVVVDAFVVRR